MKTKDKLILVELICEKQLEMVKHDYNASTSKEYLELEKIKAKLKSKSK